MNYAPNRGIYRPTPKPAWKLPEPPAGREWHRADWTEDMLPAGYRPLLLGEVIEPGDSLDYQTHNHSETWTQVHVKDELFKAVKDGFYYRTTRPLPSEPVTRPWSKPNDVPLNCWIRQTGCVAECFIVGIGGHIDGICASQYGKFGWDEMCKFEHSTDRKTWLPCTVTE